jgi:hypothetical protein
MGVYAAAVNIGSVEIERSERAWAPAVLSALLALLLYAITLRGTYIYDDVQIILLDQRIHQASLWRQIWTHDYFNGGVDRLYRPLITLSYAWQWMLHGNRAWAFHLVNILLHAGVCAAVAELGQRLAGWRVGLIAGLLFAAHPVHSEAVAGIVGRAELGCALGTVLALVLFLRRPMTTARALAIWGVSVLAILSKEPGMLIPLLLLTSQWALRRGGLLKLDDRQRQAMLLLTALLLWTIGGLIFLREEGLNLRFEWDRSFLDWVIQPLARAHGVDRLLIPFALVGRYIVLLVAPVHLSIDYGYAVIGWTVSRRDPYLWLGFAGTALWIGGAVWCWLRRRWMALFCLAGMAISYSMSSNFIVIGTDFGERLMYLPSVFFLILAAMVLASFAPIWRTAAVVVILGLCCARTFSYVARWNDRDSFYVYSLREQPRSIQLHMLVGFCAYEEYRLNDALAVLREAEALAPDYWQLWKMSAATQERAGNWAAAAADYYRAFKTAQNPGVIVEPLNYALEMAAKQRAGTLPGAQSRPAASAP